MSLVKITDHLFVNPDNVVTIMDDLTNNGEPVPGTFIDLVGSLKVGVVGKTLDQVAKALGYSGIDRV